jgi:hypothetical protein
VIVAAVAVVAGEARAATTSSATHLPEAASLPPPA